MGTAGHGGAGAADRAAGGGTGRPDAADGGEAPDGMAAGGEPRTSAAAGGGTGTGPAAGAEAGAGERCLLEGMAAAAGATLERRHETVIARAETELGLARGYLEKVYALAEEEGLEPLYAFVLVRCGVGVRELEAPEPAEEEATQQAPPEWDGVEVKLPDVVLERRLRSTFRRLRSHLERTPAPAAAAAAFLAEPDVGPVRLS
jgi:hypothetical protein